MGILEAKSVGVTYVQLPAIEDMSFSVEEGEILVILGPSGCGKSTLLRAIGGFIPVSTGEIMLRGRPVRCPGPDRIMVFQEFDQLFYWKTVRRNITFAIETCRRLPKSEVGFITEHVLKLVGLLDFQHVFPHTLSGGMKQRVALARALAINPELLLLDEPFASVDAVTRSNLQDVILSLWRDTGKTMVFVTHSVEEAMKIGCRIMVMTARPGRARAVVYPAETNPEELRSMLVQTSSDPS